MTLVGQGICLDFTQGMQNAIGLLAEQGDIESVDFLINPCKASRDSAVRGYAIGGQAQEVNALIEKVIRNFAIQDDAVNTLAQELIENAVCGYVQHGFFAGLLSIKISKICFQSSNNTTTYNS